MYILIYEHDEEWKPITYKNIRDIYEVSSYGRIRNKTTNKLLKFSENEKGYKMVGLMTNNKKRNKTFKVHLIVADAYVPQYDGPNTNEKITINHKNGDKSNNSKYNLERVPFSINIKHSYDEGLNTPRHGMLNGNSKYNDDIIIHMHQMIKAEYKPKQIIASVQDKFNVAINKYLISDVKRNKTWKYLKYDCEKGSTTIENSDYYNIIIIK